MADTDVLDPAATPAAEPAPSPEPEPQPAPDPLAQEREARAHLAGQVQALTAQVQTLLAPKPAAAPQEYTAAQIEGLYRDGKLSEADRIYWLGRIGARDEHRVVSERERAETIAARTRDDLNAYLARFPDVRTAGTERFNRVLAEVSYLESLGEPRDDPKTHLKAVRAVCGPLEGGMRRETRPAVALGGGMPAGSGPPAGPSRTDPLRGIPQDALDVYRRFGGRLDTPEQKQAYAEKYWSHRTRVGQRPA